MTLEDYLGYKLVEKEGKYYYSSNLYLHGTNITTLPDNLTVGGCLDLNGTEITSLPNNLVVDGYLSIMKTKITSLPNNLTVGVSLYLEGTKITSLPDNLTIGGSLWLKETNIATLPNNLTVGGHLYLKGTKITSLPYNLIVGYNIFSDGTKITKEDVDKVNHNVPNILFWGNKEYVKVIGGPLCGVLSYKGNIYEVSELCRNKTQYLITNDNYSKYVLKNTLEEAKKEYNSLNIKNK